MTLESLISLGYWVSTLGFIVAFITGCLVIRMFGKSILGSAFSYLATGTGIFLVITIFQSLGGEFLKISGESVDFWWHIMFYMAMISFFLGLKPLANLEKSEASPEQGGKISSGTKWVIAMVILLVIIFVIPSSVETTVVAYESSTLGQLGLHHFLAFFISGVVGTYLISVKRKLGQIGMAIANPMLIAIWALCLQHLWELLTESWAVITVSGENIEGVERIFLIITSISLAYSFIKVKSIMKG